MSELDFDLLGKQLLVALRFAEQGFPEDEVFECAVTQSSAPAGELFKKSGKRYFMRADSLPGHVAVKALGVSATHLFLETTRLDLERAKEVCEEESLPVVFTTQRVEKDGRQLVEFKYPTSQQTKKGMGNRCLWSMKWSGLPAAERKLLLRAADAVYSHDAYESYEEGVSLPQEVVTSVQGAQKMELRLNLELQQRLVQEQRPELSLEMELRPEIMLAMVQRIKRMTSEEVVAEAMKDPSPAGQRKFVNWIVCTLAEPVVKANPNTSWREARAAIRKLINKGVRQNKRP